MNNFTIFFFLQNCSKIHSRTHQIAPFFKIFSGEHAMQIGSLFSKFTWTPPPPPPRNESLDTPLMSQIMLVNSIYPHNNINMLSLLCTYPN